MLKTILPLLVTLLTLSWYGSCDANYINYTQTIIKWEKQLHPDWEPYFLVMDVEDIGLSEKKGITGDLVFWVRIYHNVEYEDWSVLIDKTGKVTKYKRFIGIVVDDPYDDCNTRDIDTMHCGEA